MKVLIVEDSDDKYQEVVELLAEVSASVEVTRGKNFVEALRILGNEKDIEVLILDIFVPMRDDMMPDSKVGLSILSEIFDGGECCQPNHIVCLSAFCADSPELQKKVSDHLVHLVNYESGSGAWVKTLRSKLDYIRKRLEKSRQFRPYGCDICIITASPEVELSQVLKLPGDWIKEFCSNSELMLYRSSWTGVRGEMSVVACEAPNMGMPASCVTAMKLVERERPKYLVMCGILAGTDVKMDLGDIIAGSLFYDYGSGKIIQNEDGVRTFLPDPRQIPLDTDLSVILKDWENTQKCMEEIGRDWSGESGGFTPKLHFGVIASGAAVVQDEQLVADIRKSSRKTVGLEMEAYAIAQVGRLCSKPKPRILVAKSVCDYASLSKSDDAQKMAAFTSARFVYSLFTSEPDMPF